jgi:2,3-bisphosphoglycerate-dependent phosphoglycerate mutase
MPTIWFIRHAESETNVGLPTASPLTAQLTPAGREQARCIADTFSTPPQLIVTSTFQRSQQTAEFTLQRFPTTRVEVWPVHEFTYLSQSLGPEPTTIFDRRPQVDAYWDRLDHHYSDGDGAESFTEFMQRVQNVVERLKHADEDFIAVYTHGQFILAILSNLQGSIIDNMGQFRHFCLAHEIRNGAIVKINLHASGEIWISPFFTSHLPPRPTDN